MTSKIVANMLDTFEFKLSVLHPFLRNVIAHSLHSLEPSFM